MKTRARRWSCHVVYVTLWSTHNRTYEHYTHFGHTIRHTIRMPEITFIWVEEKRLPPSGGNTLHFHKAQTQYYHLHIHECVSVCKRVEGRQRARREQSRQCNDCKSTWTTLNVRRVLYEKCIVLTRSVNGDQSYIFMTLTYNKSRIERKIYMLHEVFVCCMKCWKRQIHQFERLARAQ